MSHSLNEIEALSKRAARGAGLSWGIAEEGARAVRWLASHDLPSGPLLADLLEQTDQVARETLAPLSLDGIWSAASGTLCPLASGATLNDFADRMSAGQPIEMARVSHPLLVVPFAAWAAIHLDALIKISWLSVRIITDGYGIWTDDPKNKISETCAASLICGKAARADETLTKPSLRGEIPQVDWVRLGKLAHRTYAPATEESRALGAGAGVSDND